MFTICFVLVFSICIHLLLALPKKLFPLSKWGAGAKAIGERKRVLGEECLVAESSENEEVKAEFSDMGGPEPILPREIRKNGTRPKALKIHPTPNGRGRSPLYIGLRNMVSRGFL